LSLSILARELQKPVVTGDTMDALITDILAVHINEPSKHSGMLYMLFNDGELVVTKSGDLWLQRGLHTVYPGWGSPHKGLQLPESMGEFSYAVIQGMDVAKKLNQRVHALMRVSRK
jgi:hypothetical protein